MECNVSMCICSSWWRVLSDLTVPSVNMEAHFPCRMFDLVKQILRWVCWCESDVPLGHVLQQVKIAILSSWCRMQCVYHYWSCDDETSCLAFQINCFEQGNHLLERNFQDVFHTSSSKNPERSRDDAIPINWNALIWWVAVSSGASLICFRWNKRKPNINDGCLLSRHTYILSSSLSICMYLFDLMSYIKLWIFIIVVVRKNRNIVLLKPFVCLDLCHGDPLHWVGFKNPP